MKRTTHSSRLLFLAATLMLLAGCIEKGTYDPSRTTATLIPHYLEVTPSSLSFDGNQGGSATLTVQAVNTAWTIVGLPDWLTMSEPSTRSETSESITFKATPNISTTARTAVITVKSAENDWGYSLPVTVTQSRCVFTITPSSENLTFDGGAASQTVGVATLTNDWTVTAMSDLSDWCKVVRTDDSHIQVSVQPNTLSVSRTGHIELTTDTDNATITVTQRPAGISSTISEVRFSQKGGTKEVGTIASEAPWSAQTSYEWLSLTPASGEAGNTQATLHADANNTMKTRTGYLYLVLSEENRQEIKVEQEGITFSVSSDSFSFPVMGGAKAFTVSSNAAWQLVETLPDWISLSQEQGDGSAEVTLTVSGNPTASPRSATVTLRPTAVNAPVGLSITQEALNFEVTGEALHFASVGGSMSMEITSNGSWVAVAQPASWFSVNPASGTGSATITVTATQNKEKDTRQGKLTIQCGEMSSEFNIIQAGTWFNLSANAFHFTSKGGSEMLTLSTNQSWTATKSADWITLSATEGKGDVTLTISAADNPSSKARTGSVTLTSADGWTANATISQDSRYLTVEIESVSFANSGGTQTVSLSTDGTYDVTSNANWLTFSNYAGSFVITATENTVIEDREANVTVSLTDLKEGKLEHTIHVTQKGATPTFSVNPTSLSFASDGGSKTLTIVSNQSWTIASNDTWLSLSMTSGTGDASVTVTAEENISIESRSGTVTFSACGKAYTVSVTQAGAAPTFSVTPTALSFTSSIGSRSISVQSNQSWTASSNASWLSISKTSGTGDASVRVMAEKNISIGSRSGTITFSAGGKDYSVSVTQKGNPDSGGHEYVDLGLSVKWATCNVGASSPEDYGDYFAWGETEPKSRYDWSTYKWCNGSSNNMTKYNTSSNYGIVDNKTVLELEDDAAHVNWGGSWRMPTKEELDELLDNCTWTWTSQGGHNGYKVVSKSNGNSIFLPAAGYRYDTSLDVAGSYGYYWSSSLDTSGPFDAWYLSFLSGGHYMYRNGRRGGRSVRPVCP